jgi:hypothetical protein
LPIEYRKIKKRIEEIDIILSENGKKIRNSLEKLDIKDKCQKGNFLSCFIINNFPQDCVCEVRDDINENTKLFFQHLEKCL